MVEYDTRISSTHLVLSSLRYGDQRLRGTGCRLVFSAARPHWSVETSRSHTPRSRGAPSSLSCGRGLVPGPHIAVEIDPPGIW